MLQFNLDGFHNRLTRDWIKDAPIIAGTRVVEHSPAYYARKHAAKHNVAGMWRANDSFVLFYKDGDRIKQKTWAHAKPIDFAKFNA